MGPGDSLVAHTPNDSGDWHALFDHLIAVAKRTATFAAKFGAQDLGYIAGLWHDLGKANPAFQQYLEDSEAKGGGSSVPHAVWGAIPAYHLQKVGGPWEELAAPIAGHHAGLKDCSRLLNDLKQSVKAHPDLASKIIEVSQELELPETVSGIDWEGRDRELAIRMMLSALVDADRLDTEAHFEGSRSGVRGFDIPLAELWSRFEENQSALIEKADPNRVNRVRNDVYEACREKGRLAQGVFRLTVPTGGGKTRSSLAFALQHAMEHDLDRVIFVIPYTSIIDQNAREYEKILGEEVVLEHHSRVDWPEDEEGNQDLNSLRLRLATENWDAPIIVTTTVQLFESLLSYHPSRVRKIHRLANSVIVLDEVQTLPVRMLEPLTDVLRSLVEKFGTSLVLSTATQPALHSTPYLDAFNETGVTEIVESPERHFKDLQRVEYEWRTTKPTWDDLADEIKNLHQVLTVLNTRQDALDLISALSTDDGVFHLSALLCPQHRKDSIQEIKDRLKDERPVRVVSTQVVEAGVDLDFQTVYRALGPLDRIVQAAGRCNREGGMEEKGKVVVFDPAEGSSPPGVYRSGLGKARQILDTQGPEQLHDPALYETYFEALFRNQNLDDRGIQALRQNLRYRDVGKRARLIDQDTVPVVVDYGEGLRRLSLWRERPSKRSFRKVQPFTVNLYKNEVESHERGRWVEPAGRVLYEWKGEYDERYGIQQGLHDPADLVRRA